MRWAPWSCTRPADRRARLADRCQKPPHLSTVSGQVFRSTRSASNSSCRAGSASSPTLKDQGKRVFLDMKFLDIDTTVEKATANAARSGADFLTVHAIDGKTLRAAARGAAGSDLKVLGVTVLTSLDEGRSRLSKASAKIAATLVVRRAGLVHACRLPWRDRVGPGGGPCPRCHGRPGVLHRHARHPAAERRRRRSGARCDAGERHSRMARRISSSAGRSRRPPIRRRRQTYSSNASQWQLQALPRRHEARPPACCALIIPMTEQ